jgi:hypothetical protein
MLTGLDFPLWLRALHYLNIVFLSLIIRSGIEILSAHPKLYWHDDAMPGSEWIKFTNKKLPKDELWTSRDEEESFSSWIAMPGHQNLGLGRHWHFLSDALWVISGFILKVWQYIPSSKGRAGWSSMASGFWMAPVPVLSPWRELNEGLKRKPG